MPPEPTTDGAKFKQLKNELNVARGEVVKNTDDEHRFRQLRIDLLQLVVDTMGREGSLRVQADLIKRLQPGTQVELEPLNTGKVILELLRLTSSVAEQVEKAAHLAK